RESQNEACALLSLTDGACAIAGGACRPFVVQGLLQELAGLEVQDTPGRDDDRVPCLRVSALTLPLVAQHEVAESRYLYLFTAPEGFLHRLEHEVDEISRLLLREAAELRVHRLNDVGLGHQDPLRELGTNGWDTPPDRGRGPLCWGTKRQPNLLR